MRQSFSPQLMALAQAEPSAIQIAAVKAMELWAMLGLAQAEADARGDGRLSFHLSLLGAALSLPGTDDDHAGK
jgi:hypothetical protein